MLKITNLLLSTINTISFRVDLKITKLMAENSPLRIALIKMGEVVRMCRGVYRGGSVFVLI